MKSYGDACGITRALDVIGDRWALPVVRELVFGPRRYSDLAGALPGVSTNILGDRLKHLAATGVVRKRRLGPPAAATVYELTSWGAALEPVLIALGAWAAHTPIELEQQSFSPASFALSLKTTFDAQAAGEAQLHIRFVMHEDAFDVSIERGTLRVDRMRDLGLAPTPGDETSTQVHADPKTLAAILYAGVDPAEAVRAGSARIEGSPDGVVAFAQCFTLPAAPTEGL
ncbi:MAG TPA: helix-turn-helix transcriptional regulator [Candidatus Agrococcus pullicola]|uniref:Helix-turn-helix transcriptional regulator n=1 Tax=Candidatus Agrococcus pullicola TaxID=2838429 RepID=A0A9D2C9Q8_9MICO|nr:helix-turn-helix transcriptional regulator [Candidatus Agrococcus pullicola]